MIKERSRLLLAWMVLLVLLISSLEIGSAKPSQSPGLEKRILPKGMEKEINPGGRKSNVVEPRMTVSPYEWHTFYGSDGNVFGEGIVVGEDGSIYVLGSSYENWRGDGGKKPLHPFSGVMDLVIVKLDANGVYQWHTFYGSSNLDWGSDITIAKDGSIYVTGDSTASWLGDKGAAPLHPHSGSDDLVVLKLDSQGAYQWHTFYGSGNYDAGIGIGVAPNGNIYTLADSSGGWLGDGNTEPLHGPSGNHDLAVLKLNSNGAYQWHTFYGSQYDDCNGDICTGGIAIDGNENIYLSGQSRGNWLGDSGEVPIHPFSGYVDIMMMKLNSSGAYQWHTFQGGYSEYDRGKDIAVAMDGSIYVTGLSAGPWLGDGTIPPLRSCGVDCTLVVLKLDNSGAYLWHTFYGPGFGNGVVVAKDGGVYIIGDSVGFLGDDVAAPLHPHSGERDLVILRLGASGAYRWHTFYGSSGWDIGDSITEAKDGSVYATGYSDGSWLGDDGTEPLHPFSGYSDMIVLSLNAAQAGQVMYLPLMSR